jgi:signal transduction histidine kinase
MRTAAGEQALGVDCAVSGTIQHVIDALPAAIAVIDSAHLIRFVNNAWRDFCDTEGYDFPAHGVGADYFEVGLKYGAIDSVKVSDIAAGIDLISSGREDHVVIEYELSLADRHRHYTLTILPLMENQGRLVVMSHADATAVTELAEVRRDVAASLLKAQVEERRRIARELHDATAQSIAAIGIGLAALGSAEDDAERRSIMSELKGLVLDAGRQVRLYSYYLHCPQLDKVGLQAALESYIQGLSHRTGLKVLFDWQVRDRAKIARYESALQRIVQEALWNVYQHSGAAGASVAISESDDTISVTICDSGKGIDPSKAHTGLGLMSMRTRAEELGGTLTIDSTSQGTCVDARFPLAASAVEKNMPMREDSGEALHPHPLKAAPRDKWRRRDRASKEKQRVQALNRQSWEGWGHI